MIQGDHLTLPATLLSTRDLAWRIRRHVVEMTHRGNSSHIGSGLSIADVLAVLYGTILRLRPQEPQWSLRDRFILSKGHAGAAVYAVLAECGFIPLDMLASHFQDGSLLSGHISHLGIPGVEMSTGSLGHGLS
ncbi:MAG: transketolase, partial [Magnetococcales bacterium]|nr:transketolase [Magnetococcales bacterium]